MTILIVDDDFYNVESIKLKISRHFPEFETILTAYNTQQALEHFASTDISIMICDIEMPGGTGLDLLEQIRSEGRETICLFLTAFAKFEYISKAMKLSSIDYLLKPIEEESLVDAVKKAITAYQEIEFSRQNKEEASYWKESTVYLAEQFWNDVILGKISGEEEILRELKIRNLDQQIGSCTYFPVLVQCSPDSTFLAADRSLYEFTLKNILRELFYSSEDIPVIISTSDFQYLLLIPSSGHTKEELLNKCSQAIDEIVPHFRDPFNFFLYKEAVQSGEVPAASEEMLHFSHEMIYTQNKVYDLSEILQAGLNQEVSPFQKFWQESLDTWKDYLLSGRPDQAQSEILLSLKRIFPGYTLSRSDLRHVYFSLTQLMLLNIQQKMPEQTAAFTERVSGLGELETVTSSVNTIRQWVIGAISIYRNFTERNVNENDIIGQVRKYINEHLSEDMDRDSLAAIVHVHPDYLSHLFKRQTGTSIINYINDERIEEAKRLLYKGEMSISEIADRCGFQTISYFSRQFKKSTGMSPKQFRK